MAKIPSTPMASARAKPPSDMAEKMRALQTDSIRQDKASKRRFDRLEAANKLQLISMVMFLIQSKNPHLGLYDFTIHVSKTLATKLTAEASFKGKGIAERNLVLSIQRTIKRRVQAGGAPTQPLRMFFVIEAQGKRGEYKPPHLHGMILVDRSKLNSVKAALKSIAESSGPVRNSVVMREYTEAQDVHRWVNYISKNKPMAQYITRGLRKTTSDLWNKTLSHKAKS